MSDPPHIRLVVLTWTGTALDFGGRWASGPVKPFATLIPGVLACAHELRDRGVKVAAVTEHPRETAQGFAAAAKAQGFVPDATLSGVEPASPWAIFRAMHATRVFPPAAVVRVGDTPEVIAEGHSAGVWAVGVIDSSRLMGLSEVDFSLLADDDRKARRERVLSQYEEARTDAAIRTLDRLPALLDEINDQMARGARPGG